MRDDEIVLVCAVLEEACYSVDELAAACRVSAQWIERRVDEGLLGCAGQGPDGPRFSPQDLRRARRMHAIERDFDAVPELAALVADMLEELEALRVRLDRAGLGRG
jgi:chaperone modulatory protein CbpM